MQIQEVFAQANITHDDKARRVLNTAPDCDAGISVKELHQGVTIERLESLNVPVYQYATQITIHGVFKDVPEDLRVAGYKSIILNQNKSLGVKYAGIDAGKKLLMERVSRYRRKDCARWGIINDSQGCIVQRIFRPDEKQQCLDCYNSTPDNLYIGSKQAGAIWYGGYFVMLHIGAIYERNLWQLIHALTGIENETEYNALVESERIESERRQAESDAKYKAMQERKAIELANAKAQFIAPANWQPFNGNITKIGTYARICNTWSDGIALQIIKVVKRGPFLCEHVKNFTNFQYVDWQTTDKAHKCERSIDGWQITDSKPSKHALMPENKGVSSPDSTITSTAGITIAHNNKLNGIEVKFDVKPNDIVLDTLRSSGFRWHNAKRIWYARYTTELLTKIQNEFTTVTV